MLFKDELSLFSKCSIYLGLAYMTISALINISRRTVVAPEFFLIVLSGFALFLTAKMIIFSKGTLISFGSKAMTTEVANIYRAGYWLMTTGIFLTFSGTT